MHNSGKNGALNNTVFDCIHCLVSIQVERNEYFGHQVCIEYHQINDSGATLMKNGVID